MRQKQFELGKHFLIILWIGANLLLGALCVARAPLVQAFSITQRLQLVTATPTSTPTTAAPSPDSFLQFYGTIALALATILAAFIGGGFIIYQFRKNLRLEREKQQMQSQLEITLDHQRYLEELSKMRFGERLAAEREERERERQRRTATAASANAAMQRAKTPSERKKAYREAIHADPDISQLQILEMSQPLEVTKVYVRLRLHDKTQLGYEPDPLLLVAETQRDPNALIKAGRILLDTRTSEAMSPEDALRSYSRCIILGDPGAGKSTLLKYLTLKSVDKQLPKLPEMPIHIPLGEFANSDKTDLITFAAQRWYERYGFPEEEALAYIEENLANGSAMLLLDALDETVIGESTEIADDSYRRVLTAINHVAAHYHKASLVVTARKAGYYRRTRLNGFTELEVLDFQPNEIKQFITNWFACRPTQRKYATADDLNAKLENNPRMQSLAANPLLLSLIVIVYEELQDLPDRRAELYKECTNTLLFKWDTSRDIRRRSELKSELKPEHKRQLLAEIAWHFHRQGRRYFPEGELLSVIAKFLLTVTRSSEENSLLLSEIEEVNGILKTQAHGWYGFLHLTLQEYFAAQYASENNKLDELLRYTGVPWWEEVLSLYAGYTTDASPLLQKLLAHEKRQILWKDVFHIHLLSAGRALVAKPRVIQTSLREDILIHLFDLLRKTPFPLTREQIVSILVEIGGNEVKTKALAVLKDKKEISTFRLQAASILNQFGDESLVADLLAVLKDKQDNADIRWQIASILKDLNGPAVIPDMLAVLKDKQDDSSVRRWIAFLLRFFSVEPLPIPDLQAMLEDKQEDPGVRGEVAFVLSQLKEPAVIPDLQAMLEDKQEDPSVRGRVASALGEFKEPAVIPDLLAVLRDKQEVPAVRMRVTSVFYWNQKPAVIPDLLTLLKDKQDDPRVRKEIASALGRYEEPAVMPDLLTLLKDKQDDPRVREEIASALGRYKEPVVIPDLLTLLKDKQDDPRVRMQIAWVLVDLGEPRAVPFLFSFISESRFFTSTQQNKLEELIRDYASIRVCAKLLRKANLAEDIHRVLWVVCQREKIRISMIDWKIIKLVKISKW